MSSIETSAAVPTPRLCLATVKELTTSRDAARSLAVITLGFALISAILLVLEERAHDATRAELASARRGIIDAAVVAASCEPANLYSRPCECRVLVLP